MQRKEILFGTIVVLLLLAATVVQAGPGPTAAPAAPALAQQGGVDAPLGTAFTYQGRLLSAGAAVSTTCAFQFNLYADDGGGSQVGPTLEVPDIPVYDGYFTVQLDFGLGAYDGQARWLGVQVQCTGDPAYTDLGLQALNAAPQALYATQAPWTGLQGLPAGFADDVDNDVLGGLSCANGQVAKWDGSLWICGNDNGGGGGDFWSLTGNAGTDPGSHFLGTTDGVSLVLAVSGTAALRLEPDTSSPRLIGGYSGNSAAAVSYTHLTLPTN